MLSEDRVSLATYFPLREQARKHVRTAEELLKGESQQLIYACLELRLAIEAIVYETLQGYEKHLSPEVAAAYQHWQPNKVLELLRGHDPLADRSLRVRMQRVADDGSPEKGPPFFEGVDSRLTVEWVEKAHRSMGSFLHQRTLSQLKNGRQIDEAKLRLEATRVATRLHDVLKSDFYNIRIIGGFPYRCEVCRSEQIIPMASLILQGFADIDCEGCSIALRLEIDDATREPRITDRSGP